MIENLLTHLKQVEDGPDNITYNGVSKQEYITQLKNKIKKIKGGSLGVPRGFDSLEEYYKAINK